MICTHFPDSVFILKKGVKLLPEQVRKNAWYPFRGEKQTQGGVTDHCSYMYITKESGYNFRQNIPQEMVAQYQRMYGVSIHACQCIS